MFNPAKYFKFAAKPVGYGGLYLFSFLVSFFAIFLTIVTSYFLLMIIGIIFYGDPGGILNLILIPVFAILSGLIISIISLTLAIASQILARIHRILYFSFPFLYLCLTGYWLISVMQTQGILPAMTLLVTFSVGLFFLFLPLVIIRSGEVSVKIAFSVFCRIKSIIIKLFRFAKENSDNAPIRKTEYITIRPERL